MSNSILPRLRNLACVTLLAGSGSHAAVITQTVNQNLANASGWNAVIWGTPAAAPVAGNDYVVPAYTLRTPANSSTNVFPGDRLCITNNGVLALKHGLAPAVVNLILGPGTINNFQGTTTNVAIGGTLQIVGNSFIIASGPNYRNTWLQSVISGSGDVTATMTTNTLYLSGDAGAYTGNWILNSGRMEILSGTASPLGSGAITFASGTGLTVNSTNDLVLNNLIGGDGFVTKTGTGNLLLPGNNAFTGGLTNNNGLLVLTGSGSQNFNRVNSAGVLRVANSAALGTAYATGLKINPNNAETGRLELSNNVTIQTGAAIEISMRNNSSSAVQSVSGNNVIADAISIQSGGGQLYLQADAGSTLTLAGVSAGTTATGGRNFTLQGAGTGVVSGVIENGSSSALTVNKDGTGTWTLDNNNTYTGSTIVSNGVLKIGAAGGIPYSPVLHLESAGQLDFTAAGGLNLGVAAPQVLRGRGTVLGNLTTSSGTEIQVGFLNVAGQLTFNNHLTLGGNDVLRFDVATASNDVISVQGNLTLNGFTTNVVNAIGGSVDNGSYRLIDYGGSLLGGGSFVLLPPASRQTFVLDTTTPHQVNLIVTGNPTNLVWSGDNLANAWDVGITRNWNVGADLFYNADHVRFDDSGSATPSLFVASPVSVSSMVVSNESNTFVFVDTNGISSGGSLTKQGTGLLVFANAGNAFNGPITVEAGTLQIGNGDTNGSLGNGPILLQSALVMNKSTNNGATLGGNITGPGTITVKSGSLQLGGSNSYTGTTVIETGDISIRNNSALGDPSAGTVVQNGGSVRVQSLGNWIIPEPLTINGEGYADYPGALYANTISNKVTWTGPVTVGSASRIRVVNNYIQFAFANSVLGNDTPLLLTSDGTGTFVNFSNTFSLGPNGPLTKDGSGSSVLAGSSNLFASLTLSNGTVILAGGNTVATNTTLYAGTLQILSTNSPQIGDVLLNAGTLRIGNGGFNGAFPTGIVNLAASSATLSVTSSNTLTLDRLVTGPGKITKVGYGTLTILSSNDFQGNLTTGSGTPTTGGIINLRNSFGLGDGLTSKTVQLIRTELQLQNNLEIPATITFETSGGSAVTDVGIGLIPLRSLSGNNVIQGNLSLIGGAGGTEVSVDSGTLTLNGNVSANTTSSRTLTLSGAGSGFINGTINDGSTTTTLTKQGPGTWTLNNADAYSGATVVQGGTLVLAAAASIPATPSITILSNAVLDLSAVPGGFTLQSSQKLAGNGTIRGNFTAQGTVAPGTSVGALTFTDRLVLNSTTVMELDRAAAPNADLITASAITLGGDLIVTNAGATLQQGDTFNLFDGVLSGTFASVTLPTLDSGDLSWDISLLESQGIIRVKGSVPLPPSISKPILSGSDLVLQVASETGFQYVLEASSSVEPTSWTSIQTKAGGGVLTFTIPIAPSTPAQFFRIRAY